MSGGAQVLLLLRQRVVPRHGVLRQHGCGEAKRMHRGANLLVHPIPSTPINSSSVLLIQAENASQTTGSGWSTERSLRGFSGTGYIVWRGSNDFRTSDSSPPTGQKAFDFDVKQAGTYQFTARVQARVGNGSAASDEDNDAWVKFTSGSATAGVRGNAAKWTKFFVSGEDEKWKNYSKNYFF